MAKIKEKLYEHRFGLFFFVFLIAYFFFCNNGFFMKIGPQITYSMYAIDFSFGFCTKILPGAIYNLLFDEVNMDIVSAYLQVVFFVLLAIIAFLCEIVIKDCEKKYKKECVWLIFYLLVIICVGFFNCSWVGYFDFHWILATAIFFVLLSKKYFYVFIPLTFLYSIMCHYGVATCYIPLCVLILFYKILCTEDKNEKKLLWIVTAVSLISAVGLFVYMMMFELSNVKYSMEEFNAILASRGVTDFSYYDFSFFREQIPGEEAGLSFADDIENLVDSGKINNLIIVDPNNANKLEVMLLTFLQQIQIHWFITDHAAFIVAGIIQLPVVFYTFTVILDQVKNKEVKKSKKFVYVNSVILYVFVIIFNLLVSTDTLRWLCHAAIINIVIFSYFVVRDEKFRADAFEYISKTPTGVLFVYFMLYSSTVFV